MGKRGGGGGWNRKRKNEIRDAKRRRANEEGGEGGGDGGGGGGRPNGGGYKLHKDYSPAVPSNAAMESYYQLVGPGGGLHSHRYDTTSKAFVPCASDAERSEERTRFVECLRSILPASFRIDRSLDDVVRARLHRELDEFVGKDMEIEIEVPANSEPFGAAKCLLEGTIGNHGGAGASRADAHAGADGGAADGTAKCEKEEGGDDSTVTAKADGGDAAKTSDGTKVDDVSTGNEGEPGASESKVLAPAGSTSVATEVRTIRRTIAPARPIPFLSSSSYSYCRDSTDTTAHAYQLSVDRRTIRRNPALAKFHEWLKIQSDCGHITRQETVSMIPPVVLDPEPGMAVLDMCAAPGSKTCQLIEIATTRRRRKREEGEGTEKGEDDEEMELEPTGYVVANDADPKRAYMLVNQIRRMNSPASFVTACDGQYFPLLDDKKTERGTEKEGTFDRVLCDVPCSGDGTVRKNPGIWRRWNQLGSFALHPLQVSIALKGALLTKVGGYVVYSTCSMNPIEDEAVVAELLRLSEGSLELVDPRSRMKGLIARPGWSDWRVLRTGKETTRKGMKNWKKKNSPKMMEKRRMWGEKRRKEAAVEKGGAGEDDEKVPAEAASAAAEGEAKEDVGAKERRDGNEKEEKQAEEVAENDEGGENGNEKGSSEDSNKNDNGGVYVDGPPAVPSPHAKLPYVPPGTWDEDALLSRANDLGFIEYTDRSQVEPDWKRRVRVSCFPPTAEEAARFHLDRCVRCLPHDMDTGGFFVALLKKVKPMGARATERMQALARETRGGADVGTSNAKTEKDEKMAEEVDAKDREGEKATEEGGDAVMKESDAADPADDGVKDDGAVKVKEEKEPVCKAPAGKAGHRQNYKGKGDLSHADFVPVDPEMWPPLIEHFGLKPSFPKEQYFARASSDPKVIYFLSRSVKENLIDPGIQNKVIIINSGLKGFERNNKKDCAVRYRVTQEGVHYVMPYLTKRVVSANMDDFVACIASGAIKFDVFSEKIASDLKGLDPGSFVVALEGYERDYTKKLYLVMWRCRSDALNCLVAKVEMDAIMSKLRALGYVPKEPKESNKEIETLPKDSNEDKEKLSPESNEEKGTDAS